MGTLHEDRYILMICLANSSANEKAKVAEKSRNIFYDQ